MHAIAINFININVPQSSNTNIKSSKLLNNSQIKLNGTEFWGNVEFHEFPETLLPF